MVNLLYSLFCCNLYLAVITNAHLIKRVLSWRYIIFFFFFVFFQACAPRYVFHTENPRKAERVEPIGTCFMAKNEMTEFIEYSPCRTSKFNFFPFSGAKNGQA